MAWILAALVGCGSKLPTATLDVGGTPVTVEIAATHAARQEGLMHRDALGADEGMLFVYPKEEIRRFWMKDTRIPLSIAFLNRRGEIVRIAEMEPYDTRSISSLVPATYALEMNKGWFEAHGVDKGAKVLGIPADIVPE